jgi:hypothetical protein
MFRRNRANRRAARQLRHLTGSLFNPNGGLAAEARQAFAEASQLYNEGSYPDAARQFAELAATAARFNRPRRLVQLHLRAYESWLAAKNPAEAIPHGRQAIATAALHRPRQASQMAQQIIADLRAAGYTAEANALATELTAHLGEPSTASQPIPPPNPPLTFPTICPQCGGRLPRAYGDDEIECDYCGTIIRGQ